MESALLPGGGKRKKKKCKQIKNRRKRKEKKAKKTWGLVSYPLTPPPPETQSNVKLPRFGCFWVFCGLPVFFSETDPSEALGGLQERLLPSSPGRLAPAGEAAGSPRALPSAPLAPRARGELGRGAARPVRLGRCGRGLGAIDCNVKMAESGFSGSSRSLYGWGCLCTMG